MFSLTKNESTWSQGTKPFYAQVAYNTGSSNILLCAGPLFLLSKKKYFFPHKWFYYSIPKAAGLPLHLPPWNQFGTISSRPADNAESDF